MENNDGNGGNGANGWPGWPGYGYNPYYGQPPAGHPAAGPAMGPGMPPPPYWPPYGHHYHPGWGMPPNAPPPHLQPQPQPQAQPQSPFSLAGLGLTDDAFVKGLLIGAGASFLLTNETVQKNLISTLVKLWAGVQGGAEEMKERFRDAEAELQAAAEGE